MEIFMACINYFLKYISIPPCSGKFPRWTFLRTKHRITEIYPADYDPRTIYTAAQYIFPYIYSKCRDRIVFTLCVMAEWPVSWDD